MAQVTSPIILDSTGQQIHSDLQQIKNVLTTPSAAEDITFDNTGTGMQADDVQDAITELKSNLTDKLNSNWTLIKTVTATGSTSVSIPSTAKEVMAAIITNGGFYDYKIINASDIIDGSNRIFGVAFFQSSSVYAFARMTITPTAWNVLATGAQNLGSAVSSVSLYYR
jgi:hypothetical protein